jgi:TonB family protein
MEPKAQGVSAESAGFLKGCLVEADPVQERGARKTKRRAVFFSVVLQLIFVAALVAYPLLSKGETLAAVIPPTVPYIFTRAHHESQTQQRGNTSTQRLPYIEHLDRPVFSNGPIARRDDVGQLDGLDIPGIPQGPGGGDGVLGSSESGTSGPARPEPLEQRKRRIIGTIEPAMLIRRVEPTYPAIPKQLGRTGRVELHAIIATDGSIQSLEVVSGDPLFYQSALAAVQQWRYRPTILNGQAVEVDTQIVVVYTLAH